MSVSLENTMLYVFFSTFQILIFMSTGVIANNKKKITKEGISSVASLVLNFNFSFFLIFEISKVSSLLEFKKYYIIMFITWVTLSIISGLFDFLFTLEVIHTF